MNFRRISRRTALRGLGVSVALPFLEAMSPRTRGSEATPPRRMAFVYAPNGKHMPDWTPKAEGAGFELPYTLEPLRAVKDELLLLTNLTGHPTAVLPNGFRKVNGAEVPNAITFTGRVYGESELLAVAHAYQQATGHHLRHPAL